MRACIEGFMYGIGRHVEEHSLGAVLDFPIDNIDAASFNNVYDLLVPVTDVAGEMVSLKHCCDTGRQGSIVIFCLGRTEVIDISPFSLLPVHLTPLTSSVRKKFNKYFYGTNVAILHT